MFRAVKFPNSFVCQDRQCGKQSTELRNRATRLTLNEPAIEKYLKTSVIGKNLIVLDEVGSTNDYLKKLGADGCENGTVAVAREQTQGKGRLGRVWKAKKDDSITFSFLLRPKIAPSEVSSITPLAGLAVCKAIREFTGLPYKMAERYHHWKEKACRYSNRNECRI